MGITLAENMNENLKKDELIEQATFGAGCFWCVEAVFEQLDGVLDVRVGYTAGETENPNYEQICTGKTGHAEVIQIDFNPNVISFENLLNVFWKSHDPTTLNRQGADRGTQYRSGIYYHNLDQKNTAVNSKKIANKTDSFEGLIVTEILPLNKFYIAENYHQDYYRVNPNAPYCRMVIEPKLNKLFINKK
tara:strand:- start:30 stop:599 length:570 start_codon:yes stop_codon:yes gene_type:complete